MAILFVPETKIHTYAQQGNTDFFAGSLQGAYQGFYDANIQADCVRIEDIVTVTAAGGRRLNNTAREMQIVA